MYDTLRLAPLTKSTKRALSKGDSCGQAPNGPKREGGYGGQCTRFYRNQGQRQEPRRVGGTPFMGGLCTNQRFFVSKRDAVANGFNTKTHRQPPPHPSIPLAVNIYAEKNVTANPSNGRSRGTHTVLSHLHVGNFDLVAGG